MCVRVAGGAAAQILNDPDKKILYDTGGMEAVLLRSHAWHQGRMAGSQEGRKRRDRERHLPFSTDGLGESWEHQSRRGCQSESGSRDLRLHVRNLL